MKRLLLLLLSLSVAALHAAEEHDPATELASFEIADGFSVNLFASETDGVINPIQIRFDPRGRVWVIISTVYPQLEPGQVPNDKVLILEDTNADGRADKTTVFAEGLMIPTGIELVENGAYIGHGTELLLLQDRNGDDRADERKVVLRGFGTGDNHQNINSFLWGPGGELWMSQGFHTFSNVETPWGIMRMEKAGLWRFWPRRLKLDAFYGSQYEPQNPWGFAFTHWGEPIVIAGNNSSPIYAVPGMVSRRFADPPPLIWPKGQGRKSSGGDIVGTTHFPEDWQGTLILGGYINNAVWALRILDDGSGLALEDREPLIRSSSRNFRPVDVKFAPDGSLYICDWYNPIIGHYQASFRHPDRDKSHGRIWRVTANGRPLNKPPQLLGLSSSQLLQHLGSSDRWTRHFAKRILAEKPAEEVMTALERWIADPARTEHELKEALGVFQSHEIIKQDLLARLCRAEDPGARGYAAGVVGAWADRLSDPLQYLRPLISDPSARVRLHALVSSTYIPSAEAMELAAIVTDLPMDRFLEYAWKQAVYALKPYWLPALQAGDLKFDGQLSRLTMLVRADRSPDTLQVVRQVAFSDQPGRMLFRKLLLELGEPQDIARLLQDKDISPDLLTDLVATVEQRRINAPLAPDQLLNPLLNTPDDLTKALALRLSGLWNANHLAPEARALARKETASLTARQHALEALAHFQDAQSRSLLAQLSRSGPPLLRASSIAAMTRHDLASGAKLAGPLLAGKDIPEAAAKVYHAFLQREGGASTLAASLEETLPSAPNAETGLRIMSSSGRRDERLVRILAKAAGHTVAAHSMDEHELRGFSGEVRSSGDFQNGREVFRRPELGCLACHSVHGEGGQLGPDLSALGTAQPIDFIVGAILNPNQEVKEGFLSVSVTTKEGEEFQGYQLRETGEELVLRDALANREVRIPRSQIREKRQSGSIMPVGLVDTLTHEEFRDLVRYLSDLGKPGVR